MMTRYKEGQEVHIRESFTTDDGYRVVAGAVGWLMTDMGDGDWFVYIPAKGSPLLNERDFV